MKQKFSRGLMLEQFKEPAISKGIEGFYDIKTVFLPVSEDICVSPNQNVKIGQLVSRGHYPDSVDSFASVNGIAAGVGSFDIEKFEGQSFLKVDATEKPEQKDMQWLNSYEPSDEDIAFASQKCGIINTSGKLTLSELLEKYPDGVENLVIDAVDDEPYVSSRIIQLLRRGEHIAPAIRAINRLFGAKNVWIEVYKHNGEISIEIPKTVGGYSVRENPRKYPASRLYKNTEDTVYLDIGALLSFYYSAAEKKPWTNTIVTVAGDCVKNSINIEVPVGTPIGDILNYCKLKSKPKTIILGGSMTGYAVDGTDTPVLRSTKAILAFSEELSYTQTACIGCGKCIDVCPEKLLPYYIYTYYLDNNIEKLYRLSADKCTECGSCSYICPARIDLRQYVKKSRRTLLKEMWQNEQYGQDNQSAVPEK